MKTLSENWITENLIDFEYKKYVLLGYLQKVQEHFNAHKLYPDFAELIAHYKNLISLKNNTSALEKGFKKNLKGIDYQNLTLVYENTIDDESLNELKQIIAFSEPLFIDELKKGKTIFDFAEQHISTNHIGIMPIYKKEGYFILYPYQSKQVQVYAYSFSKLNLLQQEVYGLNCSYFSTYTLSLSKPVDKIKLDIIDANPELPNPAVYLFKANAELPKDETFLPIAKRLLYKDLAA
ncbi:MAG: hypothetical protein HY062_02960 [Bacteroidetes bacterium]|nr:hypothetical protein [Bacteroidota bacterium]